MSRRVVVTGLGAITPIGNSVEEFWEGLCEGRTGIGPITYFDTAEYKVKLAAELKDFKPGDYMDVKSARRMEPFSQYAVAAAKQALDDCGIDLSAEDPYRIGVSVGSGIGSLQAVESAEKRLLEKGPGRVDPLLVPRMICNMAAGNIAIQFGLKGKNINVVTACATGTHCIGEAFRSIQYGEADVMLAGGTEGSITPIGVAGFSALTALSTNEDPKTASRPFDKDRDGFVMGEGSGIIVLDALFRTPRFWRAERELTEKAMDLLAIFNLADKADWKASSLPYGQQRKLEIARALATDMKVLLLDEPAAGMNPTETAELLACINTIRDRFGVAILLIEHDMSLVMNVCQRIQVIDYGQTIAAGLPEEIASNPRVIAAYLGE